MTYLNELAMEYLQATVGEQYNGELDDRLPSWSTHGTTAMRGGTRIGAEYAAGLATKVAAVQTETHALAMALVEVDRTAARVERWAAEERAAVAAGSTTASELYGAGYDCAMEAYRAAVYTYAVRCSNLWYAN